MLPASRADRVGRAVTVALAAEADPARWRVEPGERAVVLAAAGDAGPGGPDERSDPSGAAALVALGALAQRVVCALWAEDLAAAVETAPIGTAPGPVGIAVRVVVLTE